jgi:hypothetical protein
MQELRMKTLVLVTSILGLSAGCSEDADIGIDSTPVTCAPSAVATISGTVRNPADGTTYSFDHATPSLTVPPTTTGAGASLQLTGGPASDLQTSLLLRFGFYCAAAEIATYGVAPDDQSRQLQCPFEVASALLGRIEYLPAQDGTLIIDESVDCLAGRFRVDFDENGAVAGTFSTPWQ